MILIEAMLKTLVPIFDMFLFVVLTLKVTMQNYLSESRKDSKEISVVKFRFSETTVFGIHSNITYVSEICNIIIAVMIVWKLYLLLILVSSQHKMYIIVINLVNVNHLIYHIAIDFIDKFHYFCEEKTPKIKRLNQYIKSHHSTAVFMKR